MAELMAYERVIDNITAKTLAYRGITEEAVIEPQPWYLGKNVESDVLTKNEAALRESALRSALRTMSEQDVPLNETIPKFAEGCDKVVRDPSGGKWGNWEFKDEWYAPRPPGPKAVSPIEVWEKATGEKWENSEEYKEVHKKYGIPPSKPVSGALRAGTRALSRSLGPEGVFRRSKEGKKFNRKMKEMQRAQKLCKESSKKAAAHQRQKDTFLNPENRARRQAIVDADEARRRGKAKKTTQMLKDKVVSGSNLDRVRLRTLKESEFLERKAIREARFKELERIANDKRETAERRRKAELALKAIAEAEAAKLAYKEAIRKKKEELIQKRLDKLNKQLGKVHHVAGARSTQSSAQGLKGTQRAYMLIATAPVRQFPEPGVFGYGTPVIWAVYTEYAEDEKDWDGPRTLDLYDGKHEEERRWADLMAYTTRRSLTTLQQRPSHTGASLRRP
jgi:hypothetical protein